jgi:ribonuclease HII
VRNAGANGSFNADGSDARVSLFDDLYVTSLGFEYEHQAHDDGYRFIAGIDEVGRGCLAGPVVAAACILDIDKTLPDDLNDSKQLTPETRESVAAQIKNDCIAFAIGQVEADEIDRINILEATKKAMLLAIAGLNPAADFLLIDALRLKHNDLPQRGIIKGDALSASIAAASVLAKTYRDALMKNYADQYPKYGFAEHKGYGAASHFAALRSHGPCAIHRITFRGVLSDGRGSEQKKC